MDRLDDKSGNAHHMTQTGAARPTYSATAIMGFPGIVGGAGQFMIAQSVPLASKFSAFALASTPTVPQGRLVTYRANIDAGDFAANSISLLVADSFKNFGSYGSGNLSGSFSIPVVGNTHAGVAQVSQPLVPEVFLRVGTVGDGANNTFYVDNIAADPVPFNRGIFSPGTLSLLGRDDGLLCWSGTIGETIVVSRDVTADERGKINQWLARRWPRILVVEGDSIPHAGPPDGFPYAYIPHAITPTFLDDIAVGGSNLNDYGASAPAPTRFGSLAFRAPFYLNPRVPANKNGQQYVLYFAVTNNLGGSAGLPAYVEAWGQYALNAKAAGFDKVVTSTVLSRTDIGQSNDKVRNAFNAAITAPGWAAAHGIDAIADFASDPIMGIDAAPAVNPGYFQDGVHPNAAGNARLEVIFRAALNSLPGQ